MASLPEDVVIGILSRLPASCLVRFKCVCKSWYVLITNPSFIAKNLLMNNNNNNGSLLVKRCHSISKRPVLSLLSGETLDVYANLEFRFFAEDEEKEETFLQRDLKIIGPCNGLFCLYDNVNPVLWNPATGEFKALPLSRVPRPLVLDYDTNIGFGLDPKTNDYKVVRFVDSNDRWVGCDMQPYLVELYTLSSDSWKKIDAPHTVTPCMPCSASGGFSCNVNGFLSWWVMDAEDYGDFLISFDVGNEVFLKTPLPDVFTDETYVHKTWINVAELHESIALIVYPLIGAEKCFDIWLLNEYGLKESWTKQFTIGPLLGVEWPLGFSKGGDFLLQNMTGQLLSYHLGTQEIKELQVRGWLRTLQLVYYMESLVSIKGGIRCEHEKQDDSSDMVPVPFSVRKLGQDVY